MKGSTYECLYFDTVYREAMKSQKIYDNDEADFDQIVNFAKLVFYAYSEILLLQQNQSGFLLEQTIAFTEFFIVELERVEKILSLPLFVLFSEESKKTYSSALNSIRPLGYTKEVETCRPELQQRIRYVFKKVYQPLSERILIFDKMLDIPLDNEKEFCERVFYFKNKLIPQINNIISKLT